MKEILDSGKLRLVLSLWNLVEIGSASDSIQRERRLSFLGSFDPLWVLERIDIQRQEVRRFLWKEHFGRVPEELVLLTPHLSVVDSYNAGWQCRIGLTARQWLDGVDFGSLNRSKELAPNALSVLQANKKIFEKREPEIFKSWIRVLIPTMDPDGRTISFVQQAQLLNYCHQHQDRFFAECKSIAVESALTTARVAENRKPQISDGIDLMHCVIALAYCTYFLVRDGFVNICASYASKTLAPVTLSTVYRNPQSLRDHIIRL